MTNDQLHIFSTKGQHANFQPWLSLLRQKKKTGIKNWNCHLKIGHLTPKRKCLPTLHFAGENWLFVSRRLKKPLVPHHPSPFTLHPSTPVKAFWLGQLPWSLTSLKGPKKNVGFEGGEVVVFLGGPGVFLLPWGKKNWQIPTISPFLVVYFFFEDNVLQNNQPKMFFKPYPQKNHAYSCFF